MAGGETRLAIVPPVIGGSGVPPCEHVRRIREINAAMRERRRPLGRIERDTHTFNVATEMGECKLWAKAMV